MDFNFIDAGFEVPKNSEGCVSTVCFSWSNSQMHKIFWNCTRKEAIEKFKSFASKFTGKIERDIYVWHGLTDSEILIDTTTQLNPSLTLQAIILEALIDPEPKKLNALMGFFEIKDKKTN